MAYNASQTKSPVHNYLPSSPFVLKHGDWLFYFSTEKHMIKFSNEIDKKQEWLCDSLSRRFHIPVNARELAAFQLYQQIEGRGFYVKDLYDNAIDSPNKMQFVVNPYIVEG